MENYSSRVILILGGIFLWLDARAVMERIKVNFVGKFYRPGKEISTRWRYGDYERCMRQQ